MNQSTVNQVLNVFNTKNVLITYNGLNGFTQTNFSV